MLPAPTAKTGLPQNPEGANLMIASSNAVFRKRIHEQIGTGFGAVTEARGGADALAKLEKSPYRYLVLDRHLADLNVDELERMLHGRYPGLEIIRLDSETQWEGWESCAETFPGETCTEDDEDANFPVAEEASPAASVPTEEENDTAEVPEPLPGMIGSGHTMGKIFRLARLVASRNTTVLITGETGTGKELVAQAIHDLGPRSRAPFVTVNCAAIPEALLETELFGHARGAFTGAVQSSLGRIHAAHGGTLFLDEVGDLPLSMQAKLLRFLQYGEVQRLGSSDVFRVDVRVVAATNVNLAEQVHRRGFRADLYYRLAVFPIDLPPLKSRVEDVVPLAQACLEQLCRNSSVQVKRLTPSAGELLKRHTWPGNVRELQHAVERAFILAEDNPEVGAGLFHLAAERALAWPDIATNGLPWR